MAPAPPAFPATSRRRALVGAIGLFAIGALGLVAYTGVPAPHSATVRSGS